jgi:hypothetical protein
VRRLDEEVASTVKTDEEQARSVHGVMSEQQA